MKILSPHLLALINRLHQPPTRWARFTGVGDYKALMSEIADSNEPEVIVDLLPFVFTTNAEVATAAADAVNRLIRVSEVDGLEWIVNDRGAYSTQTRREWYDLSPSQLVLLERFGEESVPLLGMASFHHNGYIREAAVNRLALSTSGAELPFLILRLNDWVSNVRDAAYRAISARVKPEYCRGFIQNFALCLRIEQGRRADHTELIHEVKELLKSEQCRDVLFESLSSPDRFIRRACFRLVLDSTHSDLSRVVTLALDDNDTVIHRWGAQKISSVSDEAVFQQLVERMKRDRFTPVRREALRIAVTSNSPHAVEELRTALLDTHRSMRGEAFYHLQRIQPTDVAAFYREHLAQAQGSTLYSVISGLGETGHAEDDRLIVPYTSHSSSKIRGAAIKALAKLRPEAHLDIFMSALEDEVPSISRQALKALARKTSLLSAARVWEIFSSTAHAHVKRNALSLLGRFAKWESISYLVRSVSENDDEIVELSRMAIRRWLIRFNRSFTSPTSEQLARVRDAVESWGALLDEKTEQLLSFYIK